MWGGGGLTPLMSGNNIKINANATSGAREMAYMQKQQEYRENTWCRSGSVGGSVIKAQSILGDGARPISGDGASKGDEEKSGFVSSVPSVSEEEGTAGAVSIARERAS